ncbi:MAG: UvrD-helicase domain-containing protein [Gammaproteobacteria bacterium]|nr:UvrD-helicase domain-containing protein [Gammaproteobacteria bacterium]
MKNTDDSRNREHIRCAEASARLLVDAGPGTGKTELAALRITNLIRTELSPGQMLVLSFSRSAVRNLTRRLARVTNSDDRVLEELRHVSIRTFDSWTFRILKLLGHPAPKLLARGHDENIAILTASITGAERDRVRTLTGDLRHLIVDEFQDLPGVRGELVLALLDLLAPPGQPGAGFTVLGDLAQAIYGFAANSTEQGFPTSSEYWNKITFMYGPSLEVLSLTHNYRADRPLAQISSSLRSVLLSQRTNAEKLHIVHEVVAALPSSEKSVGPSWLNNGETQSRAILTRTNGESLRVLQKLFGKDVEGGATPVRLRAGNHASLPPAWVAALLSRARSTQLPKSQFGRIYSHLTQVWNDGTSRSLGLPSEAVTWLRLCRASGVPENTNSIQLPVLRSRLNWPDAFPDDQIAGEDGLVVTTIHQSKGLEFDIVTMLDMPRNEPEEDTDADGPDDPSVLEEANIHYVAITRAGRELNRLDGTELYQTPRTWRLSQDRERLSHWRKGWMNLEMGLRGDIDPFGFVDPELHGGTDTVEELQDFLLQNACSLQGHKVMLCKRAYNKKAVWHIHLQEADLPALLIGRSGSQLTFDLLDMLYSRGFSLPSRIFNLRIAGVGTVSSDAEFPLDDPYRTSRLWLGVSLFGTGDFRTNKR